MTNKNEVAALNEIAASDDKVWASAEVTVNLGNYENIKIMGGCSRTVGPDDSPDELRKVMTRKIIKDVVNEGKKAKGIVFDKDHQHEDVPF